MTPTPILVSREDAAEILGMSLSHFQRFVQPYLRVVRVGQRKLYPVADLAAWAEANAEQPAGR